MSEHVSDFLFGAFVMLLVMLWVYNHTFLSKKDEGGIKLHLHVTTTNRHTGSILDAVREGKLVAFYDAENDTYGAVHPSVYTPEKGRRVSIEELQAYLEDGEEDNDED